MKVFIPSTQKLTAVVLNTLQTTIHILLFGSLNILFFMLVFMGLKVVKENFS